MPDFSDQQPSKAASNSRSLEALQNEIDSYGQDEKSESLLGKAVSKVTHAFWHKDEDALDALKTLKDEASRKQASGDAAGLQSMELDIRQSIQASQAARSTEHDISGYSTGFLKTAGLFMRGPVGLAGTVMLYGADQAKSDEHMGRDFALGMVKGGATRGLFELMGKSEMSVGLKGATLGFSSRVLDLGLSADTYKNGLGDGAQKILSGAANPLALTGDVLAFGTAHTLMGAAEGTSLAKSKLFSTMLTGGAFGMSSGATGEIMKETAEGKGYKFNKIFNSGSVGGALSEFVKETGEYDFRKIASHTLIQGGLDALAAGPGGIQGDPVFRANANRFMQDNANSLRWQISDFKTRALNLADSIDLGFGPQLALAGVPSGGRMEGLRQSPRPPLSDSTAMMTDGSSMFNNRPAASGANLDGILGAGESLRGRAAVAPEPEVRPVPERIQVRTEQERADFEKFLDQVNDNSSQGEAGRPALIDFLKAHPELEGPISQYADQVFGQLTSSAVRQFTPDVVRSLRNQVSWIDQFYKSGNPHFIVESNDQVVKFQQFAALAKPFEAGSGTPAARDSLSMFLGTNPDMHPLIKQYAAATTCEGVVAELDRYFNTRNLDSVKELQAWRAANPVEVKPNPPVAPSTPTDTALPAVAPPAEKRAASPEAAVPSGDDSGPKGRFDPSMLTNSSVHAQDLALGLSSPDITVRGPVVRLLADHLDKLTDDEFRTWMQKAPDGINRAGMVLSRPELQQMEPSVLKEFLSKSPVGDMPPPDWAKPFIAENAQREAQKKAQAEIDMAQAQAEGRKFRPYKEPRPPRPFDDTITNRLGLLETVLDTFKDKPKLAERLLDLGAHDKATLQFMANTVGMEGIGPAHKTLLENSIPNANSIEPIKYMFQFIKERNENGAYSAALLAKPPENPSLADLEHEVRTQAYEKSEDLTDDEVAERAALLEESEREANAKKWETTQNLIHDLVIGKIKMPPKPFGKPGGGRGGPPGAGNNGGFRGNNPPGGRP